MLRFLLSREPGDSLLALVSAEEVEQLSHHEKVGSGEGLHRPAGFIQTRKERFFVVPFSPTFSVVHSRSFFFVTAVSHGDGAQRR